MEVIACEKCKKQLQSDSHLILTCKKCILVDALHKVVFEEKLDHYCDHSTSDLMGLTFSNAESTGAEIIFSQGSHKWIFKHQQGCCESVSVDEIHGDLADLVGSPLLQAEESTSSEPPTPRVTDNDEYYPDSETWTFYKFATIKGSVTIRFYGSSNGYYGEDVQLHCSKGRG